MTIFKQYGATETNFTTLFFSFLQVQEVLNNLKCLSSTATSIVGTLRTADKEVQTEFPFELLEDYVVNNRKRILKLLGKAS